MTTTPARNFQRMNAKTFFRAMTLLPFIALVPAALAQPDTQRDADEEKLSLQTATAEEGFALAVTLSRKGVTETQPDTDVLHGLRPEYAHDPDSLIAASQVIAIHFQTVAAANDYWRD